MTDHGPLKRSAKGKRPNYFADPATDKLMSMVLVLAEELSVTRERLDAVERLLDDKDLISDSEIAGFKAEGQAVDERATRREAFIARLFRLTHDELRALDGHQDGYNDDELKQALELTDPEP